MVLNLKHRGNLPEELEQIEIKDHVQVECENVGLDGLRSAYERIMSLHSEGLNSYGTEPKFIHDSECNRIYKNKLGRKPLTPEEKAKRIESKTGQKSLFYAKD